MTTQHAATISELYNVPDNQKAEIVKGEIILMSPTGSRPGRAAAKLLRSLLRYEEEKGGGYAFGDNIGFVVDLPHRQSFSPGVAWYVGDIGTMDFLRGAPSVAIEIRSKNDYGAGAEKRISDKIRDYFAAGTTVVWDVDLLGSDIVRVYRITDPLQSSIARRGDVADAEPALPGWRFAVDDMFD